MEPQVENRRETSTPTAPVRIEGAALLALAEHWRKGVWDLLARAHKVRQEHFGRAVRLCSIVPGKLGHCPGDCKWCAQSSHIATEKDAGAERAALADIVAEARSAVQFGSANIGIVNSGLRPTGRDLDDVIRASNAIATQCDGTIQTCASLGELTAAQAKQLADAGLARYHHNLETSRRFFPSVVSNHEYDARLHTLRVAKNAGLDICCGALFGLGESWADRVEIALTLRDEIQPSVVPLNFLVPMPGTPLADQTPMEPLEILACIAIFRLALPKTDIKIAGGRESNLRSLQSWIFYAGATSCMIGNYLTTAGRAPQEDLQMLQDLGLEIVSDFQD